MFEKLLASIARVLDQEKIPYMVIGGQAVLLYGSPRLTEDIDITLGVDVDHLDGLLKACRRLGLRRVPKATEEFVRSTRVLPCVDPRAGIRIDFIFSFLPYEREAIQRSKKARVGNYPVHFATAEDLLIHKVLAGRPRDLEDAKGILLRHRDHLDRRAIVSSLKQFSQISEFSQAEKTFRQLLKETR